MQSFTWNKSLQLMIQRLYGPIWIQ